MIQRWSGQAPGSRLPSAYSTEARVVLIVLSVSKTQSEDQSRSTAEELVARLHVVSKLRMNFTMATVVRQRQVSRLRAARITELWVEAPVLLPHFEIGG